MKQNFGRDKFPIKLIAAKKLFIFKCLSAETFIFWKDENINENIFEGH